MLLRNFWKNNRGNVGIILALSLAPLLIIVGAAIDMVRANSAEAVLRSAADAAALAGATSGNATDQAALQKIVHDYLIANNAMQTLNYVTDISQSFDTTSATFKVSITGKIDTSFMALAGIPTIDLRADSEVNFGSQSLEVALALDNTGSMAGQKIIDLKTSAKQLVSILEQQKTSYSILKFGLVPFAQYVNVGTANGTQPWLQMPTAPNWQGCVGSRSSPLDESAGAAGEAYPGLSNVPCQAAITPLTSDLALINNSIDGMVAANSTYVPGGLLWGWNVLDSAEPFTEGLTKTRMKEVNGRKVLVLMTDGWNTASPRYPDHAGRDTAYSDAKLTTLCGNVKADGIELYTVAFQVPSTSMKTLLVDCASGPDHAFDAANGAALSASFTKIGMMMASVRFSK